MNDLFGLIFFKNSIYIYYYKTFYNINEKSNLSTRGNSELDRHIDDSLNDKIKMNDGIGQTYDKEKNYKKLITYYQNKPSSIYFYTIE